MQAEGATSHALRPCQIPIHLQFFEAFAHHVKLILVNLQVSLLLDILSQTHAIELIEL